MHWYAIYVQSNMESRVRDLLLDEGIAAFYPSITERSLDRKRLVEKRFFPGYVFARFNGMSNRARWAIRTIPAVVRIVRDGNDNPAAIPALEIATVRRLVTSPLFDRNHQASALPGDRVRIIHGALRGLEGLAERTKQGGARVVVSIQAIGLSISSTELPAESIEVIAPAQQLRKAA